MTKEKKVTCTLYVYRFESTWAFFFFFFFLSIETSRGVPVHSRKISYRKILLLFKTFGGIGDKLEVMAEVLKFN